MVAISLYRGNLHKVPEVPRRWTTPKPTISLKDFKILLRRRSRALSRLPSPVATTSASIPKPNHCPNLTDTNSCSVPVVNGNNNDSEIKLPPAEDLKEKEEERGKEEGEDAVKQLGDKADALLEVKKHENVKSVDKIDFPSEPEVGARRKTVAVISDKEKRIKEVKEKLEILNEKKHSLVQVLKQILNAEEQLKSSNMQGNSGRPPLPLQVDTATDSGSMTRINTPRIGSDGNQCGDTDGGDADDGVNHNLQPSQLPRMNSTSPSSDSQQRKVALNMMPHSYRTTLAAAGSPRRFASTAAGPGPSSVSASGTSYIALSPSPSPAASGGTSVFRDVRLPSPWN